MEATAMLIRQISDNWWFGKCNGAAFFGYTLTQVLEKEAVWLEKQYAQR
jgi:hypothetical protein